MTERLSVDTLEQVTGGYICYDWLDKGWEVVDDKTGKIRYFIGTKHEDEAARNEVQGWAKSWGLSWIEVNMGTVKRLQAASKSK